MPVALADKEGHVGIDKENEAGQNASVKSSDNEGLGSPAVGEAVKTLPALRVASDTPTRRSLREKVAKTVEAVMNSPKMELPPSRRATPVQVATEEGSVPKNPASALASSVTAKKTTPASGNRLTPSGGVSKRSPAAARWRNALKKVATPDILKRARQMRLQQQGKGQSPLPPTAMTTATTASASQRLATATTAASRAKAVAAEERKKERSAPPPPVNPPSLPITCPKEFKLATTIRSQQRALHHDQQQPMKAGAGHDRADFSRMMKKFQQKMSQRQEVVTARAAGAGGVGVASRGSRSVERRRRSRSCNSAAMADISSTSSRDGGRSVSGRRRSPSPLPFSFVERDLAKVKEKAAEKIAQEKVRYFYSCVHQ